jgi:hypothetical protein
MDTQFITKTFHVPSTWKSWLKSALAAFVSGFFNTIAAVLGPAAASQVGVQIQPFTPKQLVLMALSSGVVGVALYLKRSPLPGDQENKEP